jgi:hypothetical protein
LKTELFMVKEVLMAWYAEWKKASNLTLPGGLRRGDRVVSLVAKSNREGASVAQGDVGSVVGVSMDGSDGETRVDVEFKSMKASFTMEEFERLKEEISQDQERLKMELEESQRQLKDSEKQLLDNQKELSDNQKDLQDKSKRLKDTQDELQRLKDNPPKSGCCVVM